MYFTAVILINDNLQASQRTKRNVIHARIVTFMICIVLHIKSNLSKFDKNKFTIQPIYMKFILFICLFFATQAIFGQNISVVQTTNKQYKP